MQQNSEQYSNPIVLSFCNALAEFIYVYLEIGIKINTHGVQPKFSACSISVPYVSSFPIEFSLVGFAKQHKRFVYNHFTDKQCFLRVWLWFIFCAMSTKGEEKQFMAFWSNNKREKKDCLIWPMAPLTYVCSRID